MFVWVMLFVLIVMLIGSSPSWPHSRGWGYYPTAKIALLLIVFLWWNRRRRPSGAGRTPSACLWCPCLARACGRYFK